MFLAGDRGIRHDKTRYYTSRERPRSYSLTNRSGLVFDPHDLFEKRGQLIACRRSRPISFFGPHIINVYIVQIYSCIVHRQTPEINISTAK